MPGNYYSVFPRTLKGSESRPFSSTSLYPEELHIEREEAR